jgi:hypothetical protein
VRGVFGDPDVNEAFGQLWDYEREAWARRFFDNWRASLKWQRLEQQNPRHPEAVLRTARRRISPPQGSHLHASAAMIPQITHTIP